MVLDPKSSAERSELLTEQDFTAVAEGPRQRRANIVEFRPVGGQPICRRSRLIGLLSLPEASDQVFGQLPDAPALAARDKLLGCIFAHRFKEVEAGFGGGLIGNDQGLVDQRP